MIPNPSFYYEEMYFDDDLVYQGKDRWNGFEIEVGMYTLSIFDNDHWLHITLDGDDIELETSSQEFADMVLTIFILTR